MDKRTGKRVKQNRNEESEKDLSLDLLFERFYHAKTAEGRAKGTLQQYRLNYGFFVEYLDGKGIDRNLGNIDSSLIRDYIVFMMKEKVRFDGHQFVPDHAKTVGLSKVTINTRLKTLRVFFQFLEDEGMIRSNPMKAVKNVKEEEEEIVILTVKELQALLNAPNQKRYADFRDYVLMNLLLDSFLRIKEALSLKISDVDLDTGMITVRGETAKNRKYRVVPIEKSTVRLLEELIRDNAGFDSEYIFLANYGERLESGQFRHRLKEHAEKAGISKRVHPHLFRHTGATLFLESGGDIRHLQMMLGHSDLRMVLRYTHLSKQSLKQQHEQFSPLNMVISKRNKERKMAK